MPLHDFINIAHHFRLKGRDDLELMYEIYCDAVETLNIHHQTFKELPYVPLEHVRLILFLINDYTYRFRDLTKEEISLLLDDDATYGKLINAVIDKYGGESYFKYDEGSFLTRYSMEISTLNVYINFILLKTRQLAVHDKDEKLFIELLRSAFSLCRTISELLVNGFEKEALSSWRSLHELEATLVLLEDGKLIKDYQKHIMFNASYNKLLPKDEADRNFVILKEELREKGLKSKDMRRYIEYGWITNHQDFDATIHKYNFRDGVETLANLIDSRETYQIASEVAHSSPIMLFTRRIYFLKLTLLHLYKSFILIEQIFANLYTTKSEENEARLYLAIRKLYLDDINLVYQRTAEM